MKSYLLKNTLMVNEGKIVPSDVLIRHGRIAKIASSISDNQATIIDADGKHLFPGVIDDQVHFREPGLTWKGDLYTESRAAVRGGVTSFMEMPNTVPPALTISLLEEKYALGSVKSLGNYSFFMGTSNTNLEEIKRVNPQNICGLKIFMGSSTGNLLVDDSKTLEGVFASSPVLISTHCEDEQTIRTNSERIKKTMGENPPTSIHPIIRNEEACYLSSSFAVSLAKKFGSRLHILHISTAKELALFTNSMPLSEKKITSEACIHHLWFSDADYQTLGNLIKWNPAIKSAIDREAIFQAVLNGTIDVVATDHAPHTLEEKQQSYFKAPSGGPLIQHTLLAMLEFYHQKKITLEKIAQKMSHDPAVCFQIENRGFIREDMFADLVLVDLNATHTVDKKNLLYKCGWSPFEGTTFHSDITHTFVNGHLAWDNGRLDDSILGQRLTFDR